MRFPFSIFEFMFPFVFILSLGIIIFTFAKGIAAWNKNNHSPKMTVTAVVAAKRTSVTHQQYANAGDITGAHGFHTVSSTWHYVTFQIENGNPMEFQVNGEVYRMLSEGDRGRLTFQGTRYLGFEPMAGR